MQDHRFGKGDQPSVIVPLKKLESLPLLLPHFLDQSSEIGHNCLPYYNLLVSECLYPFSASSDETCPEQITSHLIPRVVSDQI